LYKTRHIKLRLVLLSVRVGLITNFIISPSPDWYQILCSVRTGLKPIGCHQSPALVRAILSASSRTYVVNNVSNA